MKQIKRTNVGIALLVLVTLVAAGSGCSDDTTSNSQCGEGEFVQVGDVRACVYRQSVVVENGFRCPAAFPNLIRSGGVGVCSPEETLGGGVLDDFEDVYRDRRPGEFTCMIDQNCLSGETCVDGTCRAVGGGNNLGGDAGVDAGGMDTDAGTGESDAGNDPDAGNACTSDAECAAPEMCINGRCLVLEMAPCSDDIDCEESEICEDSQCVAAVICGGFVGATCDTGFWCDYSGGSRCGIADGGGYCRRVPETCSTEVTPVCGCDGMTYGNACEAHKAGQDTSAEVACEN